LGWRFHWREAVPLSGGGAGLALGVTQARRTLLTGSLSFEIQSSAESLAAIQKK